MTKLLAYLIGVLTLTATLAVPLRSEVNGLWARAHETLVRVNAGRRGR